MTEKTDKEKLAIRVEHWIEHNSSHTREFQEGADKAKQLGHDAVCDEILLAAERLKEAGDRLRSASEKLGE